VRLFTGISLPESVTGNLSTLIDRLRPSAQLRWSPVYNLHITTKFIGEWPEEQLEQLIEALRPVGRRAPIDIAVRGIGWLPNPHSPRILYAGVQSGADLASLATATEEATIRIGAERETKPFRPHLTLARIRDSGVTLAPLRQAIAALNSQDFGEFQAESFSLFLSRMGPSGSIYTQLAEIPLAV
jgi:RNA 2',3'-cyclic 3'-phosphodiesterase